MMEVKTAHILRHRQVSLAVLQQDAAAGQCYMLATWAHFTCTVSQDFTTHGIHLYSGICLINLRSNISIVLLM